MSLDFLSVSSGGQFKNSSIENEALALFTDGQFGSAVVIVVVGDLADVWLDEFTLTRVYDAEVMVLEVQEEEVTVLRRQEVTVTLRQAMDEVVTIKQSNDAEVSIKRLEQQEFER